VLGAAGALGAIGVAEVAEVLGAVVWGVGCSVLGAVEAGAGVEAAVVAAGRVVGDWGVVDPQAARASPARNATTATMGRLRFMFGTVVRRTMFDAVD